MNERTVAIICLIIIFICFLVMSSCRCGNVTAFEKCTVAGEIYTEEEFEMGKYKTTSSSEISLENPNIIISTCRCISEYQDKFYGKGHRVFNRGQQKDKSKNQGRCTVCGEKKTF